jgi:hypothetical protein
MLASPSLPPLHQWKQKHTRIIWCKIFSLETEKENRKLTLLLKEKGKQLRSLAGCFIERNQT